MSFFQSVGLLEARKGMLGIAWLAFLGVCGGLATVSLAATTTLSTANIFEQNKRSIVLLVAYDAMGLPSSIGTGFFIAPTKIATNAHVVRSASKVMYRVIGGERTFTVGEIASYSQSVDLAILSVSERGPPVKLNSSAEPKIGEKVVAIGNPKGLTGSVSEGIVSGIRGTGNSQLIQITAPISPGSSGGPVFNSYGEVVGIARATLRDAQNINFAVPSALLLRLDSAGKSWEPQLEDRGTHLRQGDSGVEFTDVEISGVKEYRYVIQNTTSEVISNVRYLFIFRNRETGRVVDYVEETYSGIILPGLGRPSRSKVDAPFYTINPNIKQFGYMDKPGKIEFRLLDFDFVEMGPSSKSR